MSNQQWRPDWILALKKIERYSDSMGVILDRKIFNMRPDAPDRELTKILRDLLSEISAQAQMMQDSMIDAADDDDDGIELPF